MSKINTKSFVSVIIPTYKRPESLARAVDSVLSQEEFNRFEIIVVDDNNPDDVFRSETEDVMKKYQDNIKVKYIKHSKNRNGSAARNTGVRYSSGNLIALLDDDDIFLPKKLVKQVSYMDNHPEYGASYTWREYNNGSIISCNKSGDLSKEILTLKFFPSTITLMIRKECYEAIGGFDETFRRHQDFEFLLRYFDKFEIGVVKEPLSRIIGGENGDGRPRGKEYEEIKKQFFQTFNNKINEIELLEPGFKNKVYSAHYADLFTSYIHNKHYIWGAQILIRYTFNTHGELLKDIVAHYKDSIRRRIN
jgi:glycosyltransferase involved in cell wall biosynthesis